MKTFKTRGNKQELERSEYTVIKPDFKSVNLLMESKGVYENQLKEITAIAEIAKLNSELKSGLKQEEAAELSQAVMKAAQFGERSEVRKKGVIHVMREKLARMLEAILAFFAQRKKASLTKHGRKALAQLKELANVLSAGAGNEFIDFEVAFGKAYYDIMSASYNAAKYNLREDERYVDGYRRAIEGFVESVT